MTQWSHFNTSVYEEDIKDVGGGDPRYRYLPPADSKGATYRVPVNKGKRPRRKKGESPLE